MSDRLIELLNILDLSQKDFADSIQASPSAITGIMKGRAAALSADVLQRIFEIHRVNLNWLAGGAAGGPMFCFSGEDSFSLADVKEMEPGELLAVIQDLQEKLREAVLHAPAQDTLESVVALADELPVWKQRKLKQLLKLLKEKDQLLEELRND